MSAFLYDKYRQSCVDADANRVSWSADTIKAVLVKAAYTPNQATDQFLSSIVSGNRIATSAALASKTIAAGVAGAANVTLSAVTTGLTAQAIVLFKDTGLDTTSPLIAYIDDYTGLPLPTTGGDVTITWPTDSNKIFKL